MGELGSPDWHDMISLSLKHSACKRGADSVVSNESGTSSDVLVMKFTVDIGGRVRRWIFVNGSSREMGEM